MHVWRSREPSAQHDEGLRFQLARVAFMTLAHRYDRFEIPHTLAQAKASALARFRSTVKVCIVAHADVEASFISEAANRSSFIG